MDTIYTKTGNGNYIAGGAEIVDTPHNFAAAVERADAMVADVLDHLSRLTDLLVGSSPGAAAGSSKLANVPNGLLANVEDKAEAIIGKCQIAHDMLNRIERSLP